VHRRSHHPGSDERFVLESAGAEWFQRDLGNQRAQWDERDFWIVRDLWGYCGQRNFWHFGIERYFGNVRDLRVLRNIWGNSGQRHVRNFGAQRNVRA
jgi:hypothetical protein